MKRRTNGNDLIGVHALVGFLASSELLYQRGDCRHTGRTTDQYHVSDVAYLHAGFLDHVVERLLRALEQILGELFELRTSQRLVQVGGTGLGERKIGQLDLGLAGA